MSKTVMECLKESSLKARSSLVHFKLGCFPCLAVQTDVVICASFAKFDVTNKTTNPTQKVFSTIEVNTKHCGMLKYISKICLRI